MVVFADSERFAGFVRVVQRIQHLVNVGLFLGLDNLHVAQVVGGLLRLAVLAVHVTALVFVSTDFIGGTACRTSTEGVADRFGFFLLLVFGFDGDVTAFRGSKMILKTCLIFEVSIARVASNPLFQHAFVFSRVEAALADVRASMIMVAVISFLTSVAEVAFVDQSRK